MNAVFWAIVLTMFKPGEPGSTDSDLMGVHYSSEAACVAAALKEQPAGAVKTTDGRWIVYSCAKIDPKAYVATDDGASFKSRLPSKTGK